MRSTTLNLVAGAAVSIGLLLAGAAEALAGWKVAHWNVQSGFGKAGWVSGCSFKPGSNCSANAWGSGAMKQTLIDKVKNDPKVVALTLNEAWTCATPKRIQSLLGFAAVAPGTSSGEIAGVSIVARYGFAGAPEVKALPKCSSTAEQRYVVRAPVYVDSARTKVVQVFTTHWTGCSAEADATVAFMQRYAYKPRSFTGDLNVKNGSGDPITKLKAASYGDVWAKLYGTAGGPTATWNSSYGSPAGSLYKRIDYAFSKTLTPLSFGRFNYTGTAGACKLADHAGIVVEYAN
jgi:hypothetical protein